MGNINETSLAATVSNFCDDVEKYVLKSDEKLNTVPSGFTSLLTASLGKMSAYSFFQMEMAKQELNANTAILSKSLLRRLSGDDLNSIFATPAAMTFIVSFPEEMIIQRAKYDGKQWKLTLNKDTIFKVGNYPIFALDANVNILVTKYNQNGVEGNSIFAMYDVADPTLGNVVVINNPYINTRNDAIIDGKRFFTMYLTAKNRYREDHIINCTGEPQNININFSNQLIGFVVLHREQNSNTWKEIPTYLEGEQFTDGLSYSITEKPTSKVITLRFSKIPNSFNPTTGVLKICVYTTIGKDGNFTIGQIDDNTLQDLDCSMAQDTSDPYQEALLGMVPTGSIYSSEASGGANAKNIEEIREVVKNSGRGQVVTPSTLKENCEAMGLSVYKQRHDLNSHEYVISGFMNDDNGDVLPTKMITVHFDTADVPVDNETNSRMIFPDDVFKLNKKDNTYSLVPYKKLNYYKEYYEQYKMNEVEEYCSPYFLRIQNDATLNAIAYDESINTVIPTRSVYLGPVTLDKASIMDVKVYRNPMNQGDRNVGDYLKNYYIISFMLFTSDYLMNHLQNLTLEENPYIKLKIIISNTSDNYEFSVDVNMDECQFDVQNSAVACMAYIKTDSYILDNNKLRTIDSLKSIPFNGVQNREDFIDFKVNVNIAVLFKNTSTIRGASSDYDKYISPQEAALGYYVGLVYTIDKVELVKKLADKINIIPDIKSTQPVYKTAEEDIVDTYKAIEYQTDDKGNPVVVTKTRILEDGTEQEYNSFNVLHDVGDIKKSQAGRVGTLNLSSVDTEWKWSDNDNGVSNEGDVLDGKINCGIEYDNLIIVAGYKGRVGCYDTLSKTWYKYNTVDAKRSPLYSKVNTTQAVICASGAQMGGYEIYGMEVFTYEENGESTDVLVCYGEAGRICSCNLKTNYWRYYNNSNEDDPLTLICDEGGLSEFNNLYCSTQLDYEYDEGVTKPCIIIGGSKGKVIAIYTGNCMTYAANNKDASCTVTSDGSVRKNSAILTMCKYGNKGVYMSGIDGIVSVLDLTSLSYSLVSNGSQMNNVSVYASKIVGNNLVLAGAKGTVASYNIPNKKWDEYNSEEGISSSGAPMGEYDITSILRDDTLLIFAGEDGRICCYDTVSSTWYAYDSTEPTAIVNNGDFIHNSISSVVVHKGLAYFFGKSGNVEYKYRKGDIILDEITHKPIVDKESSMVFYLKGIPSYSRIFSSKSKYDEINDSYNRIIANVDKLYDKFISGATLFTGVKTTSGASRTFYFKNPKTGENIFLDSVNISLKLGVKFEINVTENNHAFLIEEIKDTITKYIQEIQNTSDETLKINIFELLEKVREDVPSIEHFEYYGLNTYDSNICQTLFCDRTLDNTINEYLSIKTTIDEIYSDFETDNITFVKAIDISIL